MYDPPLCIIGVTKYNYTLLGFSAKFPKAFLLCRKYLMCKTKTLVSVRGASVALSFTQCDVTERHISSA